MAQDQAFINDLIPRIRDSSYNDKLRVTIRENLPSILSGETNALEILFKNKLVENIYRYKIGAEIGYEKINVYINVFAYKNPDINVLKPELVLVARLYQFSTRLHTTESTRLVLLDLLITILQIFQLVSSRKQRIFSNLKPIACHFVFLMSR